MVIWVYECGVQLWLIELGKLNQNVYIELFNGCLCDECFNEYWFFGLLYVCVEIECWWWEYNEE